jgi:AraC-like DNA-binding protein
MKYTLIEVDKMICEFENPIIDIVGVEKMQWMSGNFKIAPREYSALAFRIKGTATITVNGKSCFVQSNDILYLPQGVAYYAEYSDTEMIVIHFKTAIDDTFPEVYSNTNAETIYKAFLSAHILWKEKKSGYKAYVCSQLYYILGKMIEGNYSNQIPPFFLSAVSYINGNYTNNVLTIERICKEAGIGATNLRKLFQKYYDKTPIEYITQLRLEHARNLIACGTVIEQAAEKSGFNDSKYFARVVKKHFHCTPRELKSYGK